jgi:aldehyde dehydrogenase (NAD+)
MLTSAADDLSSGYREVRAELGEAFRSGATRSLRWRAAQLEALKQALVEQERAIIAALADDLGKSAEESQLTELQPALQELALALGNLKLWAGPRTVEPCLAPKYLAPWFWLQRVWRAVLPRVLGGGNPPVASYGGVALATILERRWVVPEPLGVVLIITAWNYPLLLAIWHMTSAIAAGNCVVLKPSERAPATAKLLAELVRTYLDARCIRVVLGDASTVRRLLHLDTECPADVAFRVWAQQRPFDAVHFTGGWRIGREIARACAAYLIPCTLELGGKNPLVVDCASLSERDLARVARTTAWAKLLNVGQTCIAPDYVVLCGADRAQEAFFIEELWKSIEAFYGRPVENSTTFPRIVSKAHTARLAGLLQQSRGEVVFGGTHRENDCFFTPTIVRNVTLDDALMAEEIFGPILVVLQPCADTEQALEVIGSLPSPLVVYLMSRDAAVVQRFERASTSGSLVVNDLLGQVISPGLPFGGVGASGYGKSKGQAGFDAFSNLKSVLCKPIWIERIASARYHPLTATKISRFRRLIAL